MKIKSIEVKKETTKFRFFKKKTGTVYVYEEREPK
jgi:hypothetical protein